MGNTTRLAWSGLDDVVGVGSFMGRGQAVVAEGVVPTVRAYSFDLVRPRR